MIYIQYKNNKKNNDLQTIIKQKEKYWFTSNNKIIKKIMNYIQ